VIQGVKRDGKKPHPENRKRRAAGRYVLPFIFFLFLMILPLAPVYPHEETSAQWTPSTLLQYVGMEQRLGQQVPLDLAFHDETGRPVRLGDYFGSKPVILALTYYECSKLCPAILEGLVSSLRVLSFNVGDQFTVITISFNPNEAPTLAAARKEEYLQRYGRPGAAEGWHFLTGEIASIERLAQAVGFRYVYDAKQNQYVHASGILVLTPQGKISHYFYGIEYAPRDLRLSLVEASANKIGSLVDQVLLLCYHYNPVTGKYTMIVLNALRVGGVLTVLALGTFVFVMLRRDLNTKGFLDSSDRHR